MNRAPTPTLAWDEMESEDDGGCPKDSDCDGRPVQLQIAKTEAPTVPSKTQEVEVTLEALAIVADNELSPPEPEDQCEGVEMEMSPKLRSAIDEYLAEMGGLDSTGQELISASATGQDIQIDAYNGLRRVAALSVAVLQRITPYSSQCQALILVPDENEARRFRTVVENMVGDIEITVDVFSGDSKSADDRRRVLSLLKAGGSVDILVSTPGPAFDLIRQHGLKTDSVKVLIIDQVDRLFLQGQGKKKLLNVWQAVWGGKGARPQLIISTSTEPKEVIEFCKETLRDQVTVSTKESRTNTNSAANTQVNSMEGVQHFYIPVATDDDKIKALFDFQQKVPPIRTFLFASKDSKAGWLGWRLGEKYDCEVLQSHVPKERREFNVKAFLQLNYQFLITTDVPLRVGLLCDYLDDDAFVPLLFNFDLPPQPEIYEHRILNTRRVKLGKCVSVINFVTDQDQREHKLRRIERLYNIHIEKLPSNLGNLFQGECVLTKGTAEDSGKNKDSKHKPLLVVSGLPRSVEPTQLREKVQELASKVGGRVLTIQNNKAYIYCLLESAADSAVSYFNGLEMGIGSIAVTLKAKRSNENPFPDTWALPGRQ